MDIALWIAAGVLAVAFAGAGGAKIGLGRQRAIEAGQGYAEDLTDGTFRLIGILEVLGAIGLILPALLGIAPILVPLAASGLALVQVGAFVTHARRGNETPMMVGNTVLFALAVFVAWGRFGEWAF